MLIHSVSFFFINGMNSILDWKKRVDFSFSQADTKQFVFSDLFSLRAVNEWRQENETILVEN